MNGAEVAALEASGVCVQLGGRDVVRNCSFMVGRGEFIGIIGPNGAGKSTLLRSLRNMEPLSAGSVRLFGREARELGDKQAARLVAYMQQEVNVGFGFTALELVLTGRYAHLTWWRNESAFDREIALKYMKFTGTVELADKPVNQVSGGEKQRILLAKVLVQETPLIFLDEPTASLDLAYQEEIFHHCRMICDEGKSVLLIAHDIKLAAKFCSRLILLSEGRIIADGVPEEVITAKNLEQAYGLHSAVFTNQVTGKLDIHTYGKPAAGKAAGTVHVIGGGGTTGSILRALHERGFHLGAGVLQSGDTDADVAAAFGVDLVLGRPFADIDAAQAKMNRQKIAAADIVVLGNLYYGLQNLDNLRAAFSAGRLIVIEDTPVEDRDFTDGAATELYRQLLRNPQTLVLTLDQFMARISEGELDDG